MYPTHGSCTGLAPIVPTNLRDLSFRYPDLVWDRMAAASDSGGSTLQPDDAFSVLGNETRMEIIQTLGDSDEPLSFSELRDRVGVSDSGQFNYHLDKLVGHFIEDTDDGYGLRRAGERVIEAVVSGAVTEAPVIEPTQVDWPCPLCGATVEMSFQQEWVALSCTECQGMYSGSIAADESAPEQQIEHGYLGGLDLPPAAIQGRNPTQVLQAALTWASIERLAASSGMCPRCSASLESDLTVCEDHDPGDGVCETCNFKHQVKHEATCPNCPFRTVGPLPIALEADADVLQFVTAHGFNPVTPSEDEWGAMVQSWEEEVHSLDPVEVSVTWTLNGDSLSVTVDEDLQVVDVTETDESGPG